MAGAALRDVGATIAVDNPRRASAWTITPYRGPACSRPRVLGQPDSIDLAARHTGQSGAAASMSAIAARRSAVSRGSPASRATSAASEERRARLSPASVSAARIASDSLPPSRIRADNARSEASSSLALTIREATHRTLAQPGPAGQEAGRAAYGPPASRNGSPGAKPNHGQPPKPCLGSRQMPRAGSRRRWWSPPQP